MKTYTYVAKIRGSEEKGYIADFPLLPGCITEGDSFEEIIAMAKDALHLYLSVLKDDKTAFPIEDRSLLKRASTFYLPISVKVK